MSPPAPSVAVLDIGSNSIKVLVARREADGRLRELETRTLDARISGGIGGERPKLSPEAMRRGVAAVRDLLESARRHRPGRIVAVATSAVRDAANGAEFLRLLREATGLDVRILSGPEEAALIGRGLRCDPALRGLGDFYLFDLGGGSLECLAFRGREPRASVSVPLGCVRLAEKFAPDAALPFPASAGAAIASHVRRVLAGSGFAFDLPAGAPAVGTGGTLTAARAVLGAREGLPLDRTPELVPVASLRRVLEEVGGLDLERRRAVPGLPPRRADVFPTALATLIAVAEIVPFAAYRHSLYNLRWGLAAEILGAGPD